MCLLVCVRVSLHECMMGKTGTERYDLRKKNWIRWTERQTVRQNGLTEGIACMCVFVCVGVMWKARWIKACSVRLVWRTAACRCTHLLPCGRPCTHTSLPRARAHVVAVVISLLSTALSVGMALSGWRRCLLAAFDAGRLCCVAADAARPVRVACGSLLLFAFFKTY